MPNAGTAHRRTAYRAPCSRGGALTSARAAHRAAVRIEQDDLEAATMATESWLDLVRTRASVLRGDERLVQETVALAIDLLESGQSHAALRGRLPG
jgi:hypothetical protein